MSGSFGVVRVHSEEPGNHDIGKAGREQEREYSRGSDTSKSCRNE
ncbi:MAG TPA: hypothetical protein PLV88_01500 [Methanoregulaceae archaeon]|nr:hypothetical protein [Methanoregulaceae archaeon]HNJ80690.1 hypothetical protein [Methanoregulaceae archaeon]HNO08761.1 hypothetical protein [Methanoregulaceae archaeon]HOB59492.1 hypothetical protein [Methanoregulaceae archaeon]